MSVGLVMSLLSKIFSGGKMDTMIDQVTINGKTYYSEKPNIVECKGDWKIF